MVTSKRFFPKDVDYFSDEQHAKKVDGLTKALSGRFSTFSLEDAEKLAQVAGFTPSGAEPIKECILLGSKLPAP